MKKIALLAFLMFVLLGLFGCSNQNSQLSNNTDPNIAKNQAQDSNKKDVREVIWNRLSAQQKEFIDGTWEDAWVAKVILNQNMMSLVEDKSYVGKEVYIIDFPMKTSTGNMIIYADTTTFKYIGNGLVD